MNLFPDEIISEFLFRLPTKDVCRFKAVSKRWNSIIGNPLFISSYISFADPSWLIFDQFIQLNLNGPATRFSLTPQPRVSTLTVNPSRLFQDEPLISNCLHLMLHSSNGLLLCAECPIEIPPRRYNPDIRLFVTNPVTGEFARIPKPEDLPMNSQELNVALISRVDPGNGCLDKFVVVEYQHLERTNTAIFQCFSSDTGKWVIKRGDCVLPVKNQYPFKFQCPFEFDGKLFWVECVDLILCCDVFDDCQTAEDAKCIVIPLPKAQEKPGTMFRMASERTFGGVGGSGGCIQYVERFQMGDCMWECWRLNDYKNPLSEWSLVYNVSCVEFDRCLKRGCELVTTFHLHPPFQPDSLLFHVGVGKVGAVLSFNFQTRMIESCEESGAFLQFAPFVLPRWPILIPPRLYAAYSKEEGNGYLKEENFTEAIECYSKSIAWSPNIEAYANRAMTYLKINSFSKAEDDCTEALKIDKNCFEGYACRAIARKELGNLEGSKEDAELALKLEPSNQDVKNLCDDVKSLLDKRSYAEGGFEFDMAE